MKKHLLIIPLIILILLLCACASKPATQPVEDQAATPPASEVPVEAEEVVQPTEDQKTTQREDEPGASAADPEPYVQTVGSFLAIHEIGLGPEGYVSLTNFTSVPTTTKGLYLCQGTQCFALPEAVIEAGETGRVAVGEGQGLETVIATNATIGELKPSDGEVALFSSDKFDDPRALLVYLQWGSTPHTLTDLAVEAGLWIKTGYAPTSENATRLYRVEESGWWLFEE